MIPIFLVLFACWMLWGWSVGESKNIPWIRHWCAPIFVVTLMIITAGATGVVTRLLVQKKIQTDVVALLRTFEQQIQKGNSQQVATEIRTALKTPDPDEDAIPLLTQLHVMHKKLDGKETHIAEQEQLLELR